MAPGIPSLQTGSVILGSLSQFRDRPLATVTEARELGDLVRVRFGLWWSLIASHPDLIRQVLVQRAGSFHKSIRLKQILGDVLGQGLLTSDGEFWRRQRGMIQPAFHAKRIEAYGETMVEQTLRMLDSWRGRELIQIDQEMMRLTLGIVARTLFDAALDDSDFEQVAQAMETAQQIGDRRFARIFDLPAWLPTAERRRGDAALMALDEVVLGMIESRREENVDRGDLLSMLLLAEDADGKRMNDQQVRDEAMTLFLAGHETTAVALTWLWTLLSRHREIEARLRDEIESELDGRRPLVGDLSRLPYTGMVLDEAMRLYPPAWIFSRQAVEPLELDGVIVEKGQVVLMSPYAVHRDPRWYPDPERFDPERFEPDRKGGVPRYAYIPFGGGPRICIGNSFAVLEARLVMTTILAHCRLRLAPQADLTPNPLITLRPARSIPMLIEWG